MDILKPNGEELAIAIVRGTLSMIPVVGGLTAELIGTLIPNRRMDRVEKMLSHLKSLMAKRSPGLLEKKVQEEAYFGLVEQGAVDAAKAMTEERIKYIANILASGSASDGAAMRAKAFLGIIDELSDIELALLLHVYDVIHIRNEVFTPFRGAQFAAKWFDTCDRQDAEAGMLTMFVFKAIRTLKEKEFLESADTTEKGNHYITTNTANVVARYCLAIVNEGES